MDKNQNRPIFPQTQPVPVYPISFPSYPVSNIQGRPLSTQHPQFRVLIPQQTAGLPHQPNYQFPISQPSIQVPNKYIGPPSNHFKGSIPFRATENTKAIMQQNIPFSRDQQQQEFSRLLKTKYFTAHEIGSGSFAKVYYGIDSETGDRVAVKRIDKRKFEESYLEYIDNEIVVLLELQNEHIIKFLDLFNKDNYIYIVTELCELGDLELFIKNHFSTTRFCLPEELVTVFAYQITIAFSFGIADKNIIHRDMKLSNVLISSNLKLKVADFGLAKASIGKEHDPVGTPMTMAPEVLNNLPYGPACDVWSVGCMIFEMLEGRPPFKPKEVPGIEGLKLSINRRQLVFERSSKQAQDLINRMLTLKPNDRINWIQIVNHPWFEECVLKGEKHLQKISSEYSGYVLYEHKHFDNVYAKFFGQSLQSFVSQKVDQFYVTVKQGYYALIDFKKSSRFEQNHLKKIDQILGLSKQLFGLLNQQKFEFSFQKRKFSLEIPKWNRKKIVKDSPDLDFMDTLIDNVSPKQLINTLGQNLLMLSNIIIEFDFELFQKSFYPIITWLTILIDSKHGFLTEVSLNEEKDSSKDIEKIVLIHIPRAYSENEIENEQINYQPNFHVKFDSKYVTLELEQPKKDIQERIYFLYDIVVEHKNYLQNSRLQNPQFNQNHNLPLHY